MKPKALKKFCKFIWPKLKAWNAFFKIDEHAVPVQCLEQAV